MFVISCALAATLLADPFPGGVTMRHEMVPMRDTVRLSVYLYTPAGPGPWPVLLEQRYAPLTAPATQQRYARLAAAGYVVATANFRGSHAASNSC
jgi:predicted acyl esterase